MKLTYASEQAIAVIALLATQEATIPLSSESIYVKLGLSKTYVQKLLRKLVVAKLIGGVTGNNGGFYLTKKIKDISLYEVIEVIEGDFISLSSGEVLENSFSKFDEKAQEGDQVIIGYFKQADELWKNYLKKINVEQVMLDVFTKKEIIPTHNWNIE